MQHPVTFERPPDKVLHDDNLFDAGWERKAIDAYGRQGTFDVLTTGNPDRGLRITIERGTHRISDETNGFVVTYIDGAAAASLTSADRTLDLTGDNGTTTLAQMKTVIDAIAGLNSDYFGGEAGAGIADMPPGVAGEVAGATPDNDAWVEITNGGSTTAPGRVRFGTAVPNNNTGSTYSRPRGPALGRILPAGQSVYTQRTGGNDIAGSIELWEIAPSPL